MKITVSQLRKIIKEEVQNSLRIAKSKKTLREMMEDPVQMQMLVLDKLEEEYGGQGYDLQGIVDTVFRDLTRSGTLSGMSVEDIVEQCRELMD